MSSQGWSQEGTDQVNLLCSQSSPAEVQLTRSLLLSDGAGLGAGLVSEEGHSCQVHFGARKRHLALRNPVGAHERKVRCFIQKLGRIKSSRQRLQDRVFNCDLRLEDGAPETPENPKGEEPGGSG